MKLLLDTHTFLWFINNSPDLSHHAGQLLESEADLLLSVASLWEIAIKVNLQKLTLAEAYSIFIPKHLALNHIELLPLQLSHLNLITELPLHHRDPFDRLIIAQAIAEALPIVSTDPQFDAYGVQREW